MAASGGTIVKHYRELAFMGFWEVFINIRTIFRNIAFCKSDIESFQPDRIIYIDYPGFNMRIAAWAKIKGFENHYYISPQIWAWKENRIKKIKRDLDALYVILPFEESYYRDKHQHKVHYVGHPLLDHLSPPPQQHLDIAVEKPIVALLPENRPFDPASNQRLIQAEQFVPEQNQFGGVVYVGGTMIFTTAYWALGALKPDVMAFFGCDLVYPGSGPTHFYGTGTPDPLRKDVTLQSLEAKAARLQLIAARHGCSCVNLSAERSRLVFPRATLQNLSDVECAEPDLEAIDHVLMRERALGYYVPSGRYWEYSEQFDANALANIDALWLEAHASCQPASQTA